MQETFEQYAARLMSLSAGQNPLKIQAATPGKLAKLIKGSSKSRLTKRPAPGKWSVTEILAHLADTEMVTGYRMRTILATPGAPIAAYDQDKWAAAEQYAKHNAKLSLEAFRSVRESNLRLLKLLRPEQWKHFGIHAERGEESIERISHLVAGHDVNHINQVVAILKPKKK